VAADFEADPALGRHSAAWPDCVSQPCLTHQLARRRIACDAGAARLDFDLRGAERAVDGKQSGWASEVVSTPGRRRG